MSVKGCKAYSAPQTLYSWYERGSLHTSSMTASKKPLRSDGVPTLNDRQYQSHRDLMGFQPLMTTSAKATGVWWVSKLPTRNEHSDGQTMVSTKATGFIGVPIPTPDGQTVPKPVGSDGLPTSHLSPVSLLYTLLYYRNWKVVLSWRKCRYFKVKFLTFPAMLLLATLCIGYNNPANGHTHFHSDDSVDCFLFDSMNNFNTQKQHHRYTF